MSFRNAFPPPPIRGLKYKFLAIVTAIVVSVASLVVFIASTIFAPPSPAATTSPTLVSTGVFDAPAQGINIRSADIFGDVEYKFSTTNPAFVRNKDWVAKEGNKEDFVIYMGVIGNKETKIAGSFSLLWENVVIDEDGDACDFKITISNVELRYPGSASNRDYGKCPLIGVEKTKKRIYAHSGVNWWVRFDIRLDITKRSSGAPAKGYYMSGVKDIDIPNSYYDPDRYDDDFAEQVQLLSGFGDKVYVNPDYKQHLLIKDNNTTFRPVHSDNDTWDTGVIFSLSSSGGTFRWAGSYTAGSTLLYPFEPHTVTADAGAGGSITPGTKLVGYKNDCKEVVQANKYYTIHSVIADTTTLNVPSGSKTFSYTFPAVVADHKIKATFVRMKAGLSYDKNAPNATGSTTGTTSDAGSNITVAQNSFSYAGYTFAGWNTKPDGTGTKYLPASKFFIEENNVVLYAQWTPIYYTIEETHSAGGVITPAGKTQVRWHDSLVCEIIPDDGYYISSLTVDGVQKKISYTTDDTGQQKMEYVFDTVSANHSIHAEFSRCEVSIKWIDAHTREEVADYALLYGDSSPIPSIPTHQGRKFTHLSGDDWHDITENRTVYIEYAPYIYTIPSGGSAAYNGFTFDYRTAEGDTGIDAGSSK